MINIRFLDVSIVESAPKKGVLSMGVIMVDKQLTSLIRDKAIGSILGAACGDALGWPNERIGRSKYKKQHQELFPEFNNFFPYLLSVPFINQSIFE